MSNAVSGADWVAGFASSSTSNSNYGGKLFVKKTVAGTGYLLGWYVGSGSANVVYGTTEPPFNTNTWNGTLVPSASKPFIRDSTLPGWNFRQEQPAWVHPNDTANILSFESALHPHSV